MLKINYAREPGSNVVVHEKDWAQNVPFGYCPACGSIGIEELSIPGDTDACFFCSDETCKTIMGTRGPARTKWNQEKPVDVLEKEKDGWTWNNEHFVGQDIPMVCST